MKTLASTMMALALVLTSVVPAHLQDNADQPPSVNVPEQFPAVVLPLGFRIEKVVDGLTYPTSVTWDDQGRMYVVEAGGQFLEEPPPIRILRVEPGQVTEVANLSDMGIQDSAVGLTWYNGSFYFTHRAADRTGAVSRLSPDGTLTQLFSGIVDSQSEHQVNDIKVGPDGLMYVASGPATNSAVVGLDNAPFVNRSPEVHTTPCQDIVLTGVNFQTSNFLTPDDPSDTVQTGAFVPFGTATSPGQVIRGTNKCGGSILVFDPLNPEASLRPFAWGFRNIIGFAWDAGGEMYAAVNGFDVRGSRPVNDKFDATYRVREGAWYGWPDFSATFKPLTRRKFDSPDSLQAPQFINGQPVGRALRFLIDHAASGLSPADRSLVAGLHEINSSPSLLDVAPASWGNLAGHIFVAEWGDLAPETTPLRDGFAGFQVSRINPATGRVRPFVRNRQRGPASEQGAQGRGIERPFDVKFGPNGAMYIIDYGIARVNPARAAQGQVPYEFPPFTGVIWKVTRSTPAEPETGSLTGTVIERFCTGERGAAGVTVRLGNTLSTQTAADGSYIFEGVPKGTYTVGAFVGGYGEAKAEVTIQPDETSITNLRLPFAAPGQMLVGFVAGTTREQIDALNESYGVTVVSVVGGAGAYLLQVSQGSYTDDVIAAYRREPIVRYAERNTRTCLDPG